jgi:hypothetical protein
MCLQDLLATSISLVMHHLSGKSNYFTRFKINVNARNIKSIREHVHAIHGKCNVAFNDNRKIKHVNNVFYVLTIVEFSKNVSRT